MSSEKFSKDAVSKRVENRLKERIAGIKQTNCQRFSMELKKNKKKSYIQADKALHQRKGQKSLTNFKVILAKDVINRKSLILHSFKLEMSDLVVNKGVEAK